MNIEPRFEFGLPQAMQPTRAPEASTAATERVVSPYVRMQTYMIVRGWMPKPLKCTYRVELLMDEQAVR